MCQPPVPHCLPAAATQPHGTPCPSLPGVSRISVPILDQLGQSRDLLNQCLCPSDLANDFPQHKGMFIRLPIQCGGISSAEPLADTVTTPRLILSCGLKIKRDKLGPQNTFHSCCKANYGKPVEPQGTLPRSAFSAVLLLEQVKMFQSKPLSF